MSRGRVGKVFGDKKYNVHVVGTVGVLGMRGGKFRKLKGDLRRI